MFLFTIISNHLCISLKYSNFAVELTLKTVFDMNIYAFMDSLKRISKIKNATLLLQSGYSGFGISFKDIDKEELDWTGNI